jgi:CPA2 family monovalent cation:H+ antiporter-2
VEAHGLGFLRESMIFLLAAGILVPLLHRARVPTVLGYLVIGGLIGPYGLGLFTADAPWLANIVITDLAGVNALAELGVIFLLFMIGLELSLDRLWAMRRLVFGLGSLQVVVTAGLIGGVARAFGNSLAASVVLGSCLALSSTAIVMQLLVERRQLGAPLGQTAFAILLMQDLAVVPILFLVGILGQPHTADVGTELLVSLAQAVAVITVIYALGTRLMRPMLHLVARTRSPDMFTATTLLIILACSTLTGAGGLSMALGAFLAGLLLAETEFRHSVEVTIEPFKGLLLGLFFMSVGMGIDYRVVGREAGWIAGSVAGLFLIKGGITAALARLFRLPRATAVETGLLLGQGGEFAFVVVGMAMTLGIVPAATGHFMLIVTGLSMVATPLVAQLARRLAAQLAGPGKPAARDAAIPGDVSGHVIIAGFGRVGRMLTRILDAEGIPYLALERNARLVEQAHAAGMPVYFGDAARPELLRKAHPDRARAVLITLDHPEAAEQVVRAIHDEWPLLPVFARARDTAHARRLLQLGAAEVIPEAVEAGLQLAGRALASMGVPEDAVRRHLETQRAWQVERLKG